MVGFDISKSAKLHGIAADYENFSLSGTGTIRYYTVDMVRY